MQKLLCNRSAWWGHRYTQTLLIMKLTALLLTAAFLNVGATGISQNITYRAKNVPLKTVFAELKKQSGFYFFCDEALLEKTAPVTFNAKQEPLFTVLDKVLKPQQLNYTVKGNNIIVNEIFQVDDNPAPTISNALPPPVNGIIRDAEGNPLQGVNVVVKGTKRGITTDAEGKFSIEANENDILVISSIGYNAREVKITSINVPHIIALGKSISPLDEVIIKPYWTETKRLEIGNTVTITEKDIEKQPVNNPLLALQGRVPGLVVSQANGVPGGGITIRIQGRNNLNNTLVGSDPFIVIDGVPYASQNLRTFLGGDPVRPFPILGSSSNDGANSPNIYGNPLAFINPSDIESLTVLKDAEATAIYGSRAANGAILITTKKGRSGKMKVQIDLQQGWGKVPNKMELLNSQQYMEMRWEAKRNDGRPVTLTDFDLRGLWDTTRYTDWQKELIGGTASFTRVTAGPSGGSGNFNYLISSTYGRETTVFPGDFANPRGSLHFNFSVSSPNQRFKIQLGGNYMANTNKLPAEDYTDHALNLPPVAPALYNSDGTLNWAPDPLTGSSTWFNPFSRRYNLFETKTNNLVGNGSISYRILPTLELKSTFGYTSNTSDQFMAALDESEKPELRVSRFRGANFSFNSMRSWIVEPQMNFHHRWKNHSLVVLAGSTFQKQERNGREFIAFGHSSDLLLRDMSAGTGSGAGALDVAEYKYNAIYGRVNYGFKDKYLFSLSGRRDGSSRFGPESQFNNFWSVGTGWILSEEQFFQKALPIVSFAKLTGSYGTTGNDQIGDYRFMSLYRSSAAIIPYQGTNGIQPAGLPNPYLEWEETRKLQGGIDLGFSKDRFLLTVNFFRNRTSNSLTELRMPISTGFVNILANVPALIQNSGWEFLVNTTNVNTKHIRWTSNLNLTIPRNKLLEFPGLETSTLANFTTLGQPLGTTRTYLFYGVDPMTGAYLVSNRHGDPTSNPDFQNDRTVFINSMPRWYGGFQNSFSFHGFSLDFLISFTRQFSADVMELNTPVGYFVSDDFTVFGNQPVEVLDRWQKPGDLTKYRRYATSGSNASGDRTWSDLSFIKLKNASLSYQFSGRILRQLKLQTLGINVNAQNIFSVSQYNGLDPETLSDSALPPLRMITFGVKGVF